MRIILLVAGAAVSLTAGAAFSLQAIRHPSGAASEVNRQAPAATALFAAVHHVHTSAIPETTSEAVAPEAIPAKTAVTDYYDVQPAAPDHADRAADRAELSKAGNADSSTAAAAAPMTIASLAQEAVKESPDQASAAPARRSRKAVKAAVTKPAGARSAHMISPQRARRHEARIARQRAVAPVQAPDDNDVHNPLTTISELLQRGL